MLIFLSVLFFAATIVVAIYAIVHAWKHPDLWTRLTGRKRIMKLLFIVFILRDLSLTLDKVISGEIMNAIAYFLMFLSIDLIFLFTIHPFIYNLLYEGKERR